MNQPAAKSKWVYLVVFVYEPRQNACSEPKRRNNDSRRRKAEHATPSNEYSFQSRLFNTRNETGLDRLDASSSLQKREGEKVILRQ